MKYPEFITANSTIGVPAPSSGISKDKFLALTNAVKKFNLLHFNIILTQNIKNTNLHISATKQERANEFLQMWCDENIRALISLSGGEFMVEILPYLNKETIINCKPKWFQGFSDNTCLTYFLTVICDIASIYHYNFLYFGMNKWHASIKDSLSFLSGKKTKFFSFSKYKSKPWTAHSEQLNGFYPDKKAKWENLNSNQESIFTGRMIGGCLDILVCICGTKFDHTKAFIKKYKPDGFIWFLETCDLNIPETIRALWQLENAGWFSDVKGFIIGRPQENKGFCGWNYKKAILNSLQKFNVPIIFNADIGHLPPTIPIVNGGLAEVNFTNKKSTINYKLL